MRRISLQFKLTGIITLIALIMGIVFFVLVPQDAGTAEAKSLAKRAESVAQILANAAGPELNEGRTREVETLLEAAREDTQVRWAAYYDEAEELRLSSGQSSAPTTLEAARRTSDITGHHGVEHGDRNLGHVVVALMTADVQERVDEARLTIGVWAGVIVLAAIFIAWFFAHAITRPIREIAVAAEQIARGDVSKTARIKASRDEVGDMVRSFEMMNAHLQLLQMSAAQIGSGDLDGEVHGDGELYVAFRSMLENLRSLAGRMSESSDAVSEAAAGMFSSVRQQEASATQQNAALEEIRRALEHLASGAEGVSHNAHSVSEMAVRSLESSQRIAEQTRLVSEHSDHIGEILTLIQDIADRSDLLAFNAALEGTKAGEVGRGFSLVAEEMRRLSEHVMDSVRDIRRLVADMRSASHASVLATEEGIKLARETSASAAEISDAAGMQREGTEQAKASAEEVLRVVNQTLEAVSDTSQSAESLLQLSQDLKETMRTFKLPGQDVPVAAE